MSSNSNKDKKLTKKPFYPSFSRVHLNSQFSFPELHLFGEMRRWEDIFPRTSTNKSHSRVSTKFRQPPPFCTPHLPSLFMANCQRCRNF